MKLKNILLPAVLVFSILFSSCAKKESTENIFKYNEPQGIENLDPVMCSNYAAGWPIQQMMEGLLEYTEAMNLDACLAKSYTVSQDGLVYTFNIRKNVFFH